MGVEYAHNLLVCDPAWTGGIEVARRVHAVLEHWRLVNDEPELFDLDGGRKRKLHGKLKTLKAPPVNLLVRHSFVEAGRAAVEVMGPSYYDSVADEERYFSSVSIVVGTDFRIGPISESLYIEVIRPPLREWEEVAPYPEGSHLREFDESYPADPTTTPPKTRIDAGSKPPTGFTGVWRGGVVLDCGKDLPRLPDSLGFSLRVNEQFVAELETAFGSPLVEVGRVY